MYKFKKIASLLASTLMVGSTVGLAAAANYPAPFTNDGVGIVWGGPTKAPLDSAVVIDLTADLNSRMMGGSTGGTGITGGDSVLLSKSTDKFNLGNTASTFFTSVDDDELSVVLADGVYENDKNTEFDYEQEITLGSWSMTHFQDSDFNDEEPAIGIEFADGNTVLTYTLDFTPDAAEGGANWADFEGTTLEMLGREYYILSASNGTGTESLTLLDTANTVTLNQGETESVELASGETLDVSISVMNDEKVRLNINGELTKFLNEDDVVKLSDGVYLGVRSIFSEGYAEGDKQVEFSIGSGKIELINGEEVEINDEDISDITDHVINTVITQSSGELDQIQLQWLVDDDMWLGYGTDSTVLTMPGFNTIKLQLGNFITEAEEVTTVSYDSNDKFSIETTLTDGDVDFNVLYANESEFLGIGKDADELLVTNATITNGATSINWDSNSKWFVATWISGDDHESYVFEVSEIDDSTPVDNSTTIRSVASGSNQAVTLDIGETDNIGQINLELIAAEEDAETATIRLSAAGGSGAVYADRLVTAEGLRILLPYEVLSSEESAATQQAIFLGNATATMGDASWMMNFTEETKDGDVGAGASFTATLGITGGETTVSSVSVTDYETSDGSDDYVGYVQSDLATMTLYRTGGDQDDLQITYHGEEAYGEVYLAEAGATLTGEGSGEVMSYLDSETSSFSGMNLIVVGGSCINSVAADLLGSTTPLCGADFTAQTGVGTGQFMIETFARSGGKVATLVAGHSADDTVNAATALKTQTVDTAVGTKYVGTSSTSIDLVTEEA